MKPEHIEVPKQSASTGIWGSDVIAGVIRDVGVKYIALNPGASYRGLHDSLVNHLGNRDPQMLLCLHEEHAVAIAHGYAKVTGEPMAVVMHSNVGLMHGMMAVFNAWCDRVPMLLLGATGPIDAALRRPWIDWIHTSRDQGALIRNFTKWDDQPASVQAAAEAIYRADIIARTMPKGPTYVSLDVTIQEQPLNIPPPDRRNRVQPKPGTLASVDAQRILSALKKAERPVILCGRLSRNPLDWARRVALAEALDAQVLTDLKVGAAFPTDHPLHSASPGIFASQSGHKVIGEADVILSLDWVDLAGTLKLAGNTTTEVIHCSLDYQLHNGWGMEYQGLAALDMNLACDPDEAVTVLLDETQLPPARLPEPKPVVAQISSEGDCEKLTIETLTVAMSHGLEGETPCFVRLPIGWAGESWHFHHPLDYLGADGGAGIGSGPGMLIGAALALRGSGRLTVAVLGDGDFMMSASALWTGAHYRIPFLAIISNNSSFYNDEMHQERVAVTRNRPTENKWIGQRIDDPELDLAAIARAQGVEGFGPVRTVRQLSEAIKAAVECVKQGKCALIDARVDPGYGASMARGLFRGQK